MKTSHAELAELEERMYGGVVAKRSHIVFEKGEGMFLFDTNGRKYLDLTSAQGVAFLGHCHPILQEALAKQSSKLMSLPTFFLQRGSRPLPAETGRNSACSLALCLPVQQWFRSSRDSSEIRLHRYWPFIAGRD